MDGTVNTIPELDTLEGSVRTSGNRLRVTAQLINIADGYQVWTDRYDRQMEDVFDIQDEISVATAEALASRLGQDSGAPKVERHTEDLDAYHLYLRGRHHWFSRYRGGLEKALRCFEEAIDKDPGYAGGACRCRSGVRDPRVVRVPAAEGSLPPGQGGRETGSG